MDYSIRYLSLLSGPLTEADCREAKIIARQKILFDKNIPREMYDLKDDLYRKLREERHPTHEKLEMPSYYEPMTDGGGPPIIEHEPTPSVEPAPSVPVDPPPPDPVPEPVDNHAEVSRAFHIGSFLQHVARYGHG